MWTYYQIKKYKIRELILDSVNPKQLYYEYVTVVYPFL